MKTRKRILIAGLALVSTFAFAQKREINKAERAVKAQKYSEALDYLKEAEGAIGAADNDMQAQYYVVKGEALLGTSGASYDKTKQAAEAYNNAMELKPNLRNELHESLGNVRTKIINSAVKDQNADNFELAAEKLIDSYDLVQDPDDLYFAAGNMVNAQNFQAALKYYEKLLDMNYTGEILEYVATDKTTGEVVSFADENTRNIAVRTGEYIKPEASKTASRKGEILRNITLIYLEQGENEKAKEIMKTARLSNPDDIYLMRAEADMSYNMGDISRYNKLMNQIVATDPDNPEIYFNLGVGSQELDETEHAIEYYEKAIELRPDYEGALINLAVLKLSQESKLVEEMNSLGMSAADNKRYEQLKKDRENLYEDTLPYLEKALEINPNNIEVIRTIMNIHGQLGNDAKHDAIKAKLDALSTEN